MLKLFAIYFALMAAYTVAAMFVAIPTDAYAAMVHAAYGMFGAKVWLLPSGFVLLSAVSMVGE